MIISVLPYTVVLQAGILSECFIQICDGVAERSSHLGIEV